MSKDKMDAEKLIGLVHSRPALWNQNHQLYSSRDMKFKIWQQLGHQLGVTGSAAKLKWTCLRDTFRREVKKMYHQLTDENGTPQEPYVPKWTHFRSMLFLKDMMLKDSHNNRPQQKQATTSDNSEPPQSSHFLEPFLNDQPTTKSSVDNDIDDDDDNISDDEHDPLGAYEDETAPLPPKHRRLMSASNANTVRDVHSVKRNMSDDDEEVETKRLDWKRATVEVDEDYHFLQSILPSVRKIHSSRKTLFKMKILQLIYEEEQLSETRSSRNNGTESSSPSTTNTQVKEEILE